MDLPEFLLKELKTQYLPAELDLILKGYGAHRPVSFRINPLRISRADALAYLAKEEIGIEPVEWYQDAFTTSASEERLQATALYKEGAIYLQSLSSMLPPLVLEPRAGESILDMTAAPGGKTTQICALTQGGALVTACEKDSGRFARLQYNIRKQGAPRVTLMHTDSARLDEFFRFDRILLDAPCSGSGTLCEGETIKINEKTLKGCMATQALLLKKAWKLLKKGGILVYSTCSILRCENGEMVDLILRNPDARLLPLNLPASLPHFSHHTDTLCLYPNERFEGFFIAKIQKV